jgi:hypothetical protein
MTAFIATIQQPCRRYERPHRRQRFVVLHAADIKAMVARLRGEGHLKAGCFVLQVRQVGQ